MEHAQTDNSAACGQSRSTAGLGDCRQEVVAFALAMEAKLRENDHKRHWRFLDRRTLSRRLTEEREELRRAFTRGDPDEVLREAADVANFAMMLADYTRRYPKSPNGRIQGPAVGGGTPPEDGPLE